MRGITSARISPEIEAAGLPTYENLVRHVDRYGLDNAHSTKVADRYTTYNKFAKDSAAVTAIAYLSEDAYVRFVTRYGEASWAEAARADHQAERQDV